MDTATFFLQSRVLVVAGKGGVGKTTMVSALAHVAAGAGLRVLVVELEGRPGITQAFGTAASASYDPLDLHDGSIHVRTITPDDALLEYLDDHGMKRFSKRLLSSGIIDLVAGAIPGIRDILVLGKIKQLEQSGIADLILVDAPATGHAMTFLSSASGLLDAARGGPIRTQATDVVAMLSDPGRCQVAMVALPEEMPVNELIEASYLLEDKVGVALGPIIMNGCYPTEPALDIPLDTARSGQELPADDRTALEAARTFRLRRQEMQQAELARLARELPLPQLRVPYVFSETIGPDELEQLSGALAAGIATLPELGVGA